MLNDRNIKNLIKYLVKMEKVVEKNCGKTKKKELIKNLLKIY